MRRHLFTAVVFLVLVPVFLIILEFLLETLFRHAFSVPGLPPVTQFLREGPEKLFHAFFVSSCVTSAAWLARTRLRRTAASAKKVAAMQAQWWAAAGFLLLFGVILSFFFIWRHFPYPPFPTPTTILWVVLFLAMIEMFFFWLPTMLSSPRSYRLVVPGAQFWQQFF